MYREPNNNNSSNDTMNSSASSDENRSIQQPDALSLFMKDLRITPSSFTIVVDNPRSRSSPQNMVFQKSRSEGKGSSRWQATTEDNIVSGLKTMHGSSSSGISLSSNKKTASGKKKLRRKLKKEFVDKHQEQNDNSRSTPKRSSSFDAVSVSSRTRREQQQQEPRRGQPLSRSYSDHLGPASSCGNHSAPTLPQRRYSRDIDKALMAVDEAPRKAVRKTSCTYEVSTSNAKIPTRRRRHASKSPTRNNSDPTTTASSLSPTRSNFRVMVS